MTEPDEVITATDRRTVLRAAGAVAGAVAGVGALAACGASGGSSNSGSDAGSNGGSGGSGAGGAASGEAIPTADVPVGGAKFLPDGQTVVTQPVAGTFKAFDTTCPHQGCAVSGVEQGQLVCPCHGSTFALATGARESGPAPTGLTPRTVSVSGDTVTVS